MMTAQRLLELGATEEEVQKYLALVDVCRAREDMLRDFMKPSLSVGTLGGATIRCLTPAKYQTDCGNCVRCMAVYVDGPLKWKEKSKEEKKRLMDEFREATNNKDWSRA